jgi:hypothetical protein
MSLVRIQSPRPSFTKTLAPPSGCGWQANNPLFMIAVSMTLVMRSTHLLNPSHLIRRMKRMKDLSLPRYDKPSTFALRATVDRKGLSPHVEGLPLQVKTRQCITRQQRPSTSLGAFGSCQIRQQ